MDSLPQERQIEEYEKTIKLLKEQNKKNPLLSLEEMHRLETKLDKLKEKIFSSLTAWERVLICRHPERPHSLDYVRHLFDDFTELHEIVPLVMIKR